MSNTLPKMSYVTRSFGLLTAQEKYLGFDTSLDNNLAKQIELLSSVTKLIIQSEHMVFNSTTSLTLHNDLVLISKNNITFAHSSYLTIEGNGNLYLKAGINNGNTGGSVVFQSSSEQIKIEGDGKVYVHYNPPTQIEHKYKHGHSYTKFVAPSDRCEVYMLVNNIEDLEDIAYAPYRNYALGNDIEFSKGCNKYNFPITPTSKYHGGVGAFTGRLDGNGFTIKGLCISEAQKPLVGLFNYMLGQANRHVVVKDIQLEGFDIAGKVYAGGLAGAGKYVDIENLLLKDCNITGESIVGGIFGSATSITVRGLEVLSSHVESYKTNVSGLISGTIRESEVDSNLDCSYDNCYGFYYEHGTV
ncbi:hypothetical protein EDM53_03920 [Rickettsiales endosymbiont of Peranema trichophorum]|uniref:hypothetical protein n=1 Tax=Rickettsiales endosymbiont of Peranema trichophorum TaxID=2486577 RepID=UPI0010EE52AA|nr:hypothetical protein [Rickettsiales endosymbiont of Peranema trichophorum]RZI46699.1 hypothetical protein EDM53_03920 [Rickettsiales endosymbiont of Peranema trichophorum]